MMATDNSKMQQLINESCMLNNRLDQLQYKSKKTDRDKFEINAIIKHLKRLEKELEKLQDDKSDTIFNWKSVFGLFEKK